MPFREKMKRAFGTRPSDEGSELSFTKTSSSSSRRSRKEKKTRRNSSSNVYRPGEIMPKPKYPLAYNKAHQDKLLAYNFGDAWKKRKSVQSQYISPMGSRWPSARTSVAISRQQSYSASTTEKAADDGPITITMNGDHSYLQVGNGECFSRPLLGPRIGQGEKYDTNDKLMWISKAWKCWLLYASHDVKEWHYPDRALIPASTTKNNNLKIAESKSISRVSRIANWMNCSPYRLSQPRYTWMVSN